MNSITFLVLLEILIEVLLASWVSFSLWFVFSILWIGCCVRMLFTSGCACSTLAGSWTSPNEASARSATLRIADVGSSQFAFLVVIWSLASIKMSAAVLRIETQHSVSLWILKFLLWWIGLWHDFELQFASLRGACIRAGVAKLVPIWR